ncbi:MAG: hypothetical protein E7260_09245 [Lachnospiraceae bacterium]|nr:hypothetical protein [Lachnospiraceae bacterium]
MKNQNKKKETILQMTILALVVINVLLILWIIAGNEKIIGNAASLREEVSITQVLTPTVATNPVATMTPAATSMPMPTVMASWTVAPSPTATPTPFMSFWDTQVFSGDETVDAAIRCQAEQFAGDETTELIYDVYPVGNYISVVFRRKQLFEGEEVECLFPLVYNLTTKEQVTGSDLVKECYFAIIKERLQFFAAEHFPASEETDFITYKEIYQVEDYQKFYMTEDCFVFWFDANTLLAEGQKPFSYEVPLEEAETFFYYNLDGSKRGIAIRELDPDRPMIAFTFDDGPQFVKGSYLDIVDLKLVNLFQEYEGKATFFFLGDRIREKYKSSYAKIPQMVYDAGFEVGSHTYSHTIDFSSNRDDRKEDMWKEFNATNALIAKTTGCAPDYIRLPGGSVGKWAKEFPMPIINWSIDSVDYKEKGKGNGAEIIARRMKEKTYHDGDIILFHSIYDNSYEAVAELLEYLSEQGFQFVTLSELFYYKGVTPENGKVYHAAGTEIYK